MIMKIFDCRSDLLNDNRGFMLWQNFIFFQLRVKGSLFHVLQNNKQMSTIVEKAVNAENVLVVETTLKTNLKG